MVNILTQSSQVKLFMLPIFVPMINWWPITPCLFSILTNSMMFAFDHNHMYIVWFQWWSFVSCLLSIMTNPACLHFHSRPIMPWRWTSKISSREWYFWVKIYSGSNLLRKITIPSQCNIMLMILIYLHQSTVLLDTR